MLKKLGNSPLVRRLAAALAFGIMTLICRSCRLTLAGREHAEAVKNAGGGLLLMWHKSLVMPIYACRNMGMSPMIANSRDGEIIALFARRMGYDPVRGSAGKDDGVSALKTSLRLVRENRIVPITLDGPLGPPETVHKGAAAILKKTGCPFVPLACAMANPIVLRKSWDGHQLPRPFDRAVVVIEEPRVLPPGLSDAEAEEFIRRAVNGAEKKAEEMLK
ncbi:MAG: DUF374 domain-containing protein [Abditibacteriota bacterium]|nr:DUF374 domain-containing protein [Abditibacteriota bacterium]